MITPTAKRNIMPLMLGLAGLLAVLVYLDRSGPSEDTAAPPPQTTPPAIGNTARLPSNGATPTLVRNPLADLRLADLRDTIARPLFEPTRRPHEPPRSVVPPPPPPPPTQPAAGGTEPPRHRLLGVIMTSERSLALLAGSDGKSLRVEIGDVLDGWQVKRIAPTEVVLSQKGRDTTLRIFKR